MCEGGIKVGKKEGQGGIRKKGEIYKKGGKIKEKFKEGRL